MRLFRERKELFFLFLISAVLVYALSGSPTPDRPAWPELVTGVLLILSVGIAGAWRAVRIDIHAPFCFTAGQIFLLFGLTVPVINAAAQGNDTIQILRDVIPFLFLFLPLFLSERLSGRTDYGSGLLAAFCMLGFVFALRGLENQIEMLGRFFAYAHKAELTYFANMPSVLFAGLYLPVWATRAVIRHASAKTVTIQILCFCLSFIIFLPVIMTEQRASIAAGVIYFTAVLCAGLLKCPRQIFPALAILAIVAVCSFGFITQVFDTLYQKTLQVGVNHRFDEAAAVWESLSSSPLHILFGKGWGGGFHSPAVGNIHVNFTHSFLTSILLKSGLSGVLFALAFLCGMAQALWRCIRNDGALGYALAFPFVIDIFLYASYKSLDFGLLLLLIVIFSQKQRAMPATD